MESRHNLERALANREHTIRLRDAKIEALEAALRTAKNDFRRNIFTVEDGYRPGSEPG